MASPVIDPALQAQSVPPPPIPAPPPHQPSPTPVLDRQLNVSDALGYLDAVKQVFAQRTDVYNVFLDIMKDFKSSLIDTPGVIDRVAALFKGHPQLIQGFNTFLPLGYRIDVEGDERIIITTPKQTIVKETASIGLNGLGLGLLESAGNGGGSAMEVDERPLEQRPLPPAPAPAPPPPEPSWAPAPPPRASSLIPAPNPPPRDEPMPPAPPPLSTTPHPPPPPPPPLIGPPPAGEFDPAMSYVKQIKTRYAAQPEKYKAFLEILSSHHNAGRMGDEGAQEDIYRRVEALFADAPDLALAFKEFIPGLDGAGGMGRSERTGTDRKRRRETGGVSEAAPGKRKRKAEPRREEPSAQASSSHQHGAQGQKGSGQAANGKGKRRASPAAERERAAEAGRGPQEPPTNQFFARVRRALGAREPYLEFIKLANLFAQGRIDRRRLLGESQSFLNDELMTAWKRVLGWSEADDLRAQIAARTQDGGAGAGAPAFDSREGLDLPVDPEDDGIRIGSYRRVPRDDRMAACSGRDDLCRSVLNDEWASGPRTSLDDAGLYGATGGKPINVYEEALHRTEEERHEYDFHLDALARTTALLEPLVAKINLLPPPERPSFKLKPNLGGAGKAVHARVIRKVYGAEAAPDVLAAMQDMPGVALPAVYARLRQKEGQWRRAQTAWSRVWRAADARNAPRALDARAAAFKAADKKSFAPRAFLSQIEALAEEQLRSRGLAVSSLLGGRGPRWQMAFAVQDDALLGDVIRLLLSYGARVGVGGKDGARRERAEGRAYALAKALCGLPDGWLASPTAVQQGQTGVERPNARPGDLRKNLLAAAAASAGAGPSSGSGLSAKPTRASTRSPLATPSRGASPAPLDDATPPIDDTEGVGARRVFFVNGWFYVFFRMVETLYSRLAHFKALAAARAKVPGLVAGVPPGQELSPRAFYELALEECERLFDGLITVDQWEEQSRAMWGVEDAYKLFTIDKCLAALLKHLHTFDTSPATERLARSLLSPAASPAPASATSLLNPTSDDIRKARSAAEAQLAPDETLFRLEWAGDRRTMTLELVDRGKERRAEDEERGRWFGYVDAFVAPGPTAGVPQHKLRSPFLKRSLPPSLRNSAPSLPSPPSVNAAGALEIRVCVRTYRVFYVPRTGEAMWREGPREGGESGKVAEWREGRMRERWGA
ncbi:unnamed protein product [Peniophora sp. CBMAI 1063]|nr:unnamed protein product [Peniophora sp. CBMAI 1063]